MAPFYALTSFGTIAASDTTGYFNLVRDIYEAVLIYAFFNLLALYVAYDFDTGEVDYDRIYSALETKGVRNHIFPMNLILKPMVLISKIRAEWHFKQSRLFILQYLAIKPLTSLIYIIIDVIDSESPVTWVLSGIVFVSVSFSLYYLVLFYQILHEELAYAKPLLKFLSVKGVLFFTFWQDFVVEIIVDKALSTADESTKLFIITDIENMLVCLEMVILTIMTTIAFSYKDFKETQKKGFLKREGIMTLTKKLVDNVFTDGFVSAVKDLKDLKEPLRDPFKKYRDANIEHTHLMTLSSKISNGMITEDQLETQVTVFEKPAFIPGFVNNAQAIKSEIPVEEIS